MQKFLQLIKREWEITTLAVTTIIVLIAAAAWVYAFIFGKDGTIEKPTVLPQPPQYFNTDNTDYLNYYAVNKAKVRPFLFKHKVPPTPQPAPSKASTPPPKPSDKPSDKPAPKPEPKQPDKPTPKPADKPAPPPPPPHLAFLSYNGFYQGISGIPQALITYDDKGKGKNNTKPFSKDLEVKASEQFESLFSLKSLDQEKIVVIFQGKEYTVKRGENQKFTLPE